MEALLLLADVGLVFAVILWFLANDGVGGRPTGGLFRFRDDTPRHGSASEASRGGRPVAARRAADPRRPAGRR